MNKPALKVERMRWNSIPPEYAAKAIAAKALARKKPFA
jgi:hypothetical protein